MSTNPRGEKQAPGEVRTYADIEALPPNMVGEIVFGVLHAHPRPAPRVALAIGELATELSAQEIAIRKPLRNTMVRGPNLSMR